MTSIRRPKLLGYRTIEFFQIFVIALAYAPTYLCRNIPNTPENDLGGMIPAIIGEYLIGVIAVTLIFFVCRMKNGPNERDGLLHLFVVTSGFLATFLLFPFMYFALPIAVVAFGIYNIIIIERSIRSLKPVA